jgi:hypothetical protein
MYLLLGPYYCGLSPPSWAAQLSLIERLPKVAWPGGEHLSILNPKTNKMKKQFFFLLSLLTMVLFFTACKKNMAYEKQVDPIKQSRIWFNQQFDASLTVKNNQLTGGDKYPLWQLAKQYAYNGLSIVEVPLVFKNRPIYGVKEGDGNLSLPANASVSKLMIARNGAGGYRAAIVDMVADKVFYNAGGDVSQIALNRIPQSFAGYILSRKWTGEAQVGYRIEAGRTKQKIMPRKATAPATDDTEIKTSIAGDGIPFGILCAGCDFYMSSGDVASYPVCASVALACGLEMWDTDYTGPCDNGVMNLFGCPCENGSINYNDCGFGNGGNGGGNNTLPPYQLTTQDRAIFAAIDAEDAQVEAIYSNSDCKGTNRTGNPKWPGTKEHWLIMVDYVHSNQTYGEIEYAIPGSSPAGNRGYADIVNTFSNEIFEIKPDKQEWLVPGDIEVARYVEKARIHCPVRPGSFPPFWTKGTTYPTRYLTSGDPNTYLQARLMLPGLIGYTTIQRTSPTPVPVVVPVTIVDKIKRLIEKLREAGAGFEATVAGYLRENPELVNYFKVAAIGAAVAIVVGTIVEDFLTGGAGLWNDIQSCALAYKIVRYAWAL